MEYRFCVQDPASPSTRYLFEEVVALLTDPATTTVEGIFAFATSKAISDLVQDASFKPYMARGGRFCLIVGLDRITDRRALDLLLRTSDDYPGQFAGYAYKNRQAGLFHPKLLRATGAQGMSTLLVGSGNFTPGGLRSNIEAYSIVRFDPNLETPDTAWDAFLDDHDLEVSEIDDEALELGDRNAERNRVSRNLERRLSRIGRPGRPPDGIGEVVPLGPADAGDRVLIAYVPKAGGRWHQVHFNEVVVRTYFRAQPNTPDRVFLFRYEAGGYVAEPPRPVVFPPRNVNYRIEFGARPGIEYPATGRPILVLREIGVRQHSYVLLFPGDPGHSEMERLLLALPKVGNGLRRAITSYANAQAAWPGLPL